MQLKASHLEKCYYSPDKITVLEDVSLDLPAGATVSLIGSSGSGKSTLLNCLGLLDSLDGGTIEVDGVNVSSLNDSDQSQFRLETLSFVFQFHHLIPELTVLQNVLLPGTLKGVENKAKAFELLEEVGIVDKARNYPWQLSGGEAQRVAIARALLNDPKFLLTDEATGNLDPERAQAVVELLFSLAQRRNTTLISVTHDEKLAKQYKYQFSLKNGRLWDCVGKS